MDFECIARENISKIIRYLKMECITNVPFQINIYSTVVYYKVEIPRLCSENIKVIHHLTNCCTLLPPIRKLVTPWEPEWFATPRCRTQTKKLTDAPIVLVCRCCTRRRRNSRWWILKYGDDNMSSPAVDVRIVAQEISSGTTTFKDVVYPIQTPPNELFLLLACEGRALVSEETL